MSYKSKPIILQVLPALNSGGVERGTIEIAKALKNENFMSYVASSGGKLTENLNDLNIPHLNVNLASKNPLIILLNIFHLVNIIKKYDIDIIHARSRGPAWSAYFAAKITGIKFITSFHGLYSFNNRFKKFYNSIMIKSDHVIAVSNFIKDHIEKNYGKKMISVIHRGADLDYFNPDNITKDEIKNFKLENKLDLSKKIILLPARITRWKGHLYLLDILSKVQKDYICLFVGEHKNDNYMREITQKISNLNLLKKIIILPSQNNMPLIYAVSDLVISASIRPEAFGRTIIEAQAMGRLVIATNLGGATETIIDDVTGWLAPVNEVDKFTSIVDYALSLSNENINKISSKARGHIKTSFSLNKMTSKTIDLYKDLASS